MTTLHRTAAEDGAPALGLQALVFTHEPRPNTPPVLSLLPLPPAARIAHPATTHEATMARAEAPVLRLHRSRIGQRHVVAAVEAPAHAPEWAAWLEEIGFVPGEQVAVMARAALGGDPIVVRVGQSTFALRAAEAACVLLEPEA